MNADPRPPFLQLTTIEDPACGLHRIAMLEISGALRCLDEPGPEPATAVHECRKAIKRLRALARLARRRDFAASKQLDRLLSRAGRALSGQRDADVVVGTARELEPAHVTGAVATALHSVTLSGLGTDPGLAAASLAKALRRFEALFEPTETWRPNQLMDAVVDEFETLQRRARRFDETHTEGDAHRLRKSVQRCLAQLRVLAAVTHADVDARITLLNDLAQQLGKHHDLSVLRITLKSVPKSTLSKPDRKKLRRAARARQHEIDSGIASMLQTIADSSGEALRAELTGEIRSCGDVGQEETGDVAGGD